MANIYRSIDDIYRQSLEKWRFNKGRGTISYDSYLDVTKPAVRTVLKYLAANPEGRIVIVVPNSVRANLWEVNISVNMDKPADFNDRVRLLKIDDILQQKLTDDVELMIVDCIELYTDHYREDVLKGKYIKFKYGMGLTNSVMPEKLNYIAYEHFGVIHKITKLDLVTSHLLSNVSEYMVAIDMNEEDQHKYNMYSEFITETLEMYGDFETIQNCYAGDASTGVSPDHFRQQLAAQRGWTKEIDLDYEYNRSVDRYYAPSNIYERCKTFSQYIQERKRLISDNDSKLKAVVDIVKKYEDKKILIINKRGPFASQVAYAINDAVKTVFKQDAKPATNNLTLFQGGIPTEFKSIAPQVAVEYHMDIPKQSMQDPDTGQVIKVKSGPNKGNVKQIGSKSISNMNLKGFNEHKHSVICSNNALIKDMKIEVDFIIITSPYCSPMSVHQYRVQKLDFIGTPTLINVYLNNTQEIGKVNNALVKSKHNVTFSSIEELNI